MNIIAVTILFTCYHLAAVSGYATCGIGRWADTSCIELSACWQYTQPMKEFYNTDASQHNFFMTNRVQPAMCGFLRQMPMVCCPNAIQQIPQKSQPTGKKDNSCGAIIWHKSLSPDGMPAELEEFSWLALLEYETKNGKIFGCGGVLISDRHILTAAHCLGLSENKLTGVRLGEHDLPKAKDCIADPLLPYCSKAVVDVGIEQQIIHENYDFLRGPSDFDPFTYNVAILKLNRSVTNDVIKPICLPEGREPKLETSFTVDVAGKFLSAGWGVIFGSMYPKSLVKRMSRLKEVNKDYCNYQYGRNLPQDIICAISKSYTTACIADSGGPLMSFNRQSRMTVTGIYSPVDGQSCRTNGIPSTFVDVRNYVDWIRLKMRNYIL